MMDFELLRLGIHSDSFLDFYAFLQSGEAKGARFSPAHRWLHHGMDQL